MATAYDTANIIIPQGGGYKAGTLYGWNPQAGNTVDFSVTQNTGNATRVNSAGQRVQVAANTPRWDWAEGLACPSLLVEPQRTNLFPQDLSGSGVVTRTVTVVNGTEYTVSVEGSGSMALSGAGTGTVSDGSPVTFTASGTSLTLTLTGSLDFCQVEAGGYATSIIWTELTTATRNADVISATGLSSLLGQSEGSILGEIKPFDTSQMRITLTEPSASGTIRLTSSSGNLLLTNPGRSSISVTRSGVFTGDNYLKFAGSYSTSSIALSVNGTDGETIGNASPTATLNNVHFYAFVFTIPFYGRLRSLAILPIALTSEERNNFTS